MSQHTGGGTQAVAIQKAVPENVPAIKQVVDAAYSKYIERIGKPPAPMTADYQELLTTHDVFVLLANERVVGSIVLLSKGDSLQVNSVVVDPSTQGQGYGRILMTFAENTARAWGLTAVTLYTNEKMHENVVLYTRLGYAEMGCRLEHGFNRVFFRKNLT